MAISVYRVLKLNSKILNLSYRTFSTILSKKPFINRNAGFSSFFNIDIPIRNQDVYTKEDFSTSCILNGSAARAETTSTTQGLSKLQAQELVLRLNGEERIVLLTALQEFESKLVKEEYQGQLAASRWRSKYGRPAKLPTLGDVDPTGTYCLLPEDWLMKKCVDSVPKPTSKELLAIGFANSIPFVGFGFLDNFFMLFFGDYIDFYLGSTLCLSTMAAAALGNTLSDILGIGSAFYVERLANRIGVNTPKLSPIQMEMPSSRHSANLGRVLGVTLGCILGMCPLLFFKNAKGNENADEKNIDQS